MIRSRCDIRSGWPPTTPIRKRCKRLREKQAALKQFSADLTPVDDFAKAPVVIAIEPTVKMDVDEKAVEEDYRGSDESVPRLSGYSDGFERFAAIFGVNEYLVNSEGTVTRDGTHDIRVQ